MKMKPARLAALALLGATALATPSQAAISLFFGADNGSAVGGPNPNSDASQAGFLAALGSYGGVATQGFGSFATGFSNAINLGSGASAILNATDFGPGFSGISSTTIGNLFGYDINGDSKWLGFPSGSATFSFGGGGTYGFGSYFTGLQTVFGPTLTIEFNDGSQQLLNLPINVGGGAQFFGFTSTVAISSLVVSRPGVDAWGMDLVSYNVAAAVPEPATWAMMLAGFAGLGMATRRRRRSLAAAA
jgi:hypothetical protein